MLPSNHPVIPSEVEGPASCLRQAAHVGTDAFVRPPGRPFLARSVPNTEDWKIFRLGRVRLPVAPH